MLIDTLPPENIVSAIADDDADVGAISITIDHVHHPLIL
jgi:hypothetical protein